MVTLGAGAVNGRKKRLPAVVPDTRAHGVVFQQAEQRRAARLAKKRAAASETPERAADRILKPITHRQGSPTLTPALEARPAHSAAFIAHNRVGFRLGISLSCYRRGCTTAGAMLGSQNRWYSVSANLRPQRCIGGLASIMSCGNSGEDLVRPHEPVEGT